MLYRALAPLAVALIGSLAAQPALAQYRGMSPGWPNYASGYYAPAAPAYGYGPQYAARPVQTAYANPAYYGTYPAGAAQYQAAQYQAAQYQAAQYQQPVQYQQPTTAYYAPAQQGYAPTTAYYAPAPAYTVSPAGNVSAGAEAYGGYGQPTRVNYVPPRFAYRTVYSPVTVYSYRPPVTAYSPVVGQPTTCLQPAVTTCCQPARQPARHCLWWLNPCNWFSGHAGHWGGGSSGCCGAPAAPPVTAACCTSYATTCGTASCAQPYYPVQPVVPVVPVPAITAPANTIPSIRSPIIGTPTVPAPPTRFNTTPVPGAVIPGAIVPGTGLPADVRPSLTPAPGGSFNPGVPFTPAPGGSFNSGSNYPPAIDPYSSSSTTPATPPTASPTVSKPAVTSPARSGSFPTDPRELEMTGPVLHQSGAAAQPADRNTAAPSLHPDVQPVPDPEAHQPARVLNRAPQLLDPRDKSARRGDIRWAVVPAVWPKKPTAEPRYEHRSLIAPAAVPVAAPAVDASQYDDGGWKSGGL